ncbi:aspartate aminotransferase family protein [Halalkalibacter nanhaiisediminis]|uniref:Adenosylmethionine-8-amino-7-oxononanoate aminotransferase n=1 Tax=Halalkalibacter nanhaiisediminis TaxID=688079 RepID=A0A562QQS4_9BACI|nr:aspartate aminotransferase family protein [Halalkalibacter nanhaiisediminis]TWI59055.1 adenosylmethionine-8-amino-7-oxononanoate aminotransferase [Halalkalibacter nanhaiisediminis]
MKRSLLIKPNMDDHYPTVSHGQGIYIFDNKGKKYLDGSSGAVVASIGHAVPEIMNSMTEQAQHISFVYRSQFTSAPAEKLADKLNKLVHANQDYYSFFVNSGSEATETAMKTAIQHWQEKGFSTKNKILSRWSSYHGITLGALSLSGHVERRKRFIPLLEQYPSVSAPYCYRCPFQQTYPSCQLMCANELDTVIRRIGSEHIAAFMAEPIVGAAGAVIIPPTSYYEKIKEICDHHHILFITDEVMTGLGRTGKMFGIDHWGVKPDIIALGKGMSAGYTPIAATLASESVMEPILQGSKSIMSGHTYSANPQSAAVALEVLNYIEKHQLVKKSAKHGEYLLQKLKQIQFKYQMVGDVRGKGLMIGVEFVADKTTKVPFTKNVGVTKLVIDTAMEKGLLVYPAAAGSNGGDGDAVMIAPPLVITRDEIDHLVTLFEETIQDVQGQLIPQNRGEKDDE